MNALHEGVVVILENMLKQIALQLRDDAPYDETWGLFGGWMEQTETPEQAVVREIEEELGFVVNSSRLSFLTTHLDGSAKSHIFHYLVADELSHAVLTEGKAFQFMTMAEIRDCTIIPRHKAILEWFAVESRMSMQPLAGERKLRHPISW